MKKPHRQSGRHGLAKRAAATKPTKAKAPPRPEAEILAELQGLCTSPGYVHALAHLCFRDSMVIFEAQLTEQDLHKLHSPERLIRTEINTLLGLMIKAAVDWALPIPDELQRYLDETERLMDDCTGACRLRSCRAMRWPQ